ncbi:MAG: glycosyltransferase [Thermoplasmata archaeon]
MFTDTWLPTMDGVVNSIIQFRKCLENEGHEVFIFAPGKEDRVDPDDDHIFRFKGKTFNMYPEYRLALYPSKRTHDLLVENDIDIIHNHGVAFMGIKAMIAAKFFDLPCVFNFHTKVTEAVHYYPVNLSEALLKRLTWIYLRYLLRRSNAVIAPSEQALKELEEKCPNMRYSDVVAPGIDKDRYHKDVDGSLIREKMDLDGSDVLLHVGRISKEKNLDLILDSLPILKKKNGNAKFLIVGDGPAKEYYEKHVKDKGLEDVVTFTGFVPEKQLPKYYAASDAFVISSRFETLGIVLIEALATGTVVAGIDHGVIPDIIDHRKNGFLFGDSREDCAEKIAMALKNRNMVKENGNGINFDNKIACKKLEKVYQEAIRTKEERIF